LSPIEFLILKLFLLSLLVFCLSACQLGEVLPVLENTDQELSAVEVPESDQVESTVIEEKEEVFRFAVFADNHSDNDSMAALLAMARAEDGVDFVLHLGDLTRVGGRDELRLARETLEQSGLPYYAVPGDHDIVRAGGVGYFVEILGEREHRFTHEGWQFILLDNSDLAQEPITAQGWQWLQEMDSAQPLVIGMHHPPRHSFLKKNTMGETPLGEEAATRLMNILKNRTAPTYLMAGEMHTYHQYRLGEIQVTVAGAAGIPTNPFLPQYVLVIVYNDRTLATHPRLLTYGGNN